MNFVKYRKISYLFTIILIAITGVSLVVKGLNYGIDFKGGYILETHFKKQPHLDTLRHNLEKLHIGAVSIQQIGKDPADLLIKIENKKDQSDQVSKVKASLGDNVEYRQISVVGPKVGKELISGAVKAIALTLLAMLVYVTIRFQWRYAVSAIATLFYDCIMIVMLYTVFPLEFSESAIIAILITAGYSMNDTVVIFDRIRENLSRKPKLPIEDIINSSIVETLSRTTLTVFATLLSLIAMYIWGGPVIAEFSFPIMIGVLSGTYSSIFISAPLLLTLGFSKKPLEAEI